MVQEGRLLIAVGLMNSITIMLSIRFFLMREETFTTQDDFSAKVSSLRLALVLPCFAIISMANFVSPSRVSFVFDGAESVVEGYCVYNVFNIIFFSCKRQFAEMKQYCGFHPFNICQIGFGQFLLLRPIVIFLRGGVQLLPHVHYSIVRILLCTQFLSVLSVVVIAVHIYRSIKVPNQPFFARKITFLKVIVLLTVIQNAINSLSEGVKNSHLAGLLSLECTILSLTLNMVFIPAEKVPLPRPPLPDPNHYPSSWVWVVEVFALLRHMTPFFGRQFHIHPENADATVSSEQEGIDLYTHKPL